MLSLTCKDLAGIKTLLLMDRDQQRKLRLPKNVARINDHEHLFQMLAIIILV